MNVEWKHENQIDLLLLIVVKVIIIWLCRCVFVCIFMVCKSRENYFGMQNDFEIASMQMKRRQRFFLLKLSHKINEKFFQLYSILFLFICPWKLISYHYSSIFFWMFVNLSCCDTISACDCGIFVFHLTFQFRIVQNLLEKNCATSIKQKKKI